MKCDDERRMKCDDERSGRFFCRSQGLWLKKKVEGREILLIFGGLKNEYGESRLGGKKCPLTMKVEESMVMKVLQRKSNYRRIGESIYKVCSMMLITKLTWMMIFVAAGHNMTYHRVFSHDVQIQVH
ncbi:unnamed protein product [Vicia faba]|uniref:Uncharacterized protein n=1 Tax=Vicia faba TaxID=3906 RepID=A0AAV0YJQ8_VICFA|nr:unnamed protein product [Vicia faba]